MFVKMKMPSQRNEAAIITLICFSFMSTPTVYTEERNPSTLLAVQAIVRHGDREPDDSVANPLGQLTDRGKKQMYDVGVLLKEIYSTFLKNCSATEISILSSDKDRTIESALLIALGLNLNVRVPVRTIPADVDDIIQISRDCPRYQKQLDESIAIYIEDFIDKNLDFFMKYANFTGDLNVTDKNEPPDKIDPFVFYQEQAFYNASKGLQLDQIALETVMSPDLNFKPAYEALKVDSPEKQRLYMGPLFRQILGKFDAEDRQKLTFYSGHDRNLYSFMLTLQIWQEPGKTPPYGAALLVELHEAPSIPRFLEFWYKNDTGVYLLEVPGCGSHCSYPVFVSKFEQIIKGDYEIECQL